MFNLLELFGSVLWHINHCRSFNTKFLLYMYNKFMISKPILKITFLNEPVLIFFTQSNDQTSISEMQSVYSEAAVNWARSHREGLTSQQRCSQCILTPQSTGPGHIERVLPLSRDAVSIFCSLSQLGQVSSRESYLSAKMQSVISTDSVNWARSQRESLTSLQRCSVFCSPSWQSQLELNMFKVKYLNIKISIKT